MKELLIKRYKQATKAQHQGGLDWYFKANDICYKLAAKYNTTPMKVAGIIAALSPRNKWERNIQDAESVLKHGMKARCCTTHTFKQKAVDILALPDCLPYAITYILKGPKITNFFWNIYKPNDSKLVTLDSWAFRAAGLSDNPKVKERRECTKAYLDVAKEVGLKPHQLQAIVWVQIRDEQTA